MKLLTRENLMQLPPLYSQDDKGDDAIAVVKFFNPCGSWTWWATEGSFVCPYHANHDCQECPKPWSDFLFFGLVQGFDLEVGYFTLTELAEFKGPLGIGIERDRGFTPTAIKNLKQKVRAA